MSFYGGGNFSEEWMADKTLRKNRPEKNAASVEEMEKWGGGGMTRVCPEPESLRQSKQK